LIGIGQGLYMSGMISLDGSSLTLEDLAAIATGEQAVLAPAARKRMEAARAVVEAAVRAETPVYGLTTGVADRKAVSLDADARRGFSQHLVKGHLMAQGPPAPPVVVRAAMACLVNAYAKGAAGVRPELADMILGALNDGLVPAVRSLGSVGVADLGPMADLADGLMTATGFAPSDNEGLALINSNAFSTGWAAMALVEAERLLDTYDAAAALDLEAFAANPTSVDPVIAEMRPYPGIAATLARLRTLLEGSAFFEPGTARNLQDPLTFRCIPQLHGAARDALAYVHTTVETELNSAQNNPAVVIAEGRIASVGNFEVAALSAAMDFARIALAPVVSAAAERTVKLLQTPWSGLPAGLAAEPGTSEDALAEYAVASQALAAEARLLAHPVSFEIVSTSKADGIEDRTTMAPLAARRLADMVELGTRVAAVELLVAAQAVDLRRLPSLGRGTGEAHRSVRERVGFLAGGETLPSDLEPLIQAVRSGVFALPAETAAG
jgi:histidine ammonia-lyase